MAATKTSAEVIIDGRVYTLSGYESEEYLQRIASYLNAKMSEFSNLQGYTKLNSDYKSVLMQINIADDYFRAQKSADELRREMAAKEKDLYDIKHELISTQMKLDNNERTLKALRDENDENAKKIIRLETELKTRGEHKG